MNIIQKVTQSRYTLKKILENEWDTSTIADLSNQEIEKMYTVPSSKNKNIAQFGIASACNFSLQHKFITTHRIHIIYYNFPEIGKVSSKITKSACDKVRGLYTNGLIEQEDSLLIIINDSISESLENSFNELNISLQSDLEEIEINESIIDEMKKNNYPLQKKHLRNIHIININTITNNIMEHRLVPHHKVIRNVSEIDDILLKTNCTLSQLPIILKGDTISKLLRLSNGDLCEITRSSTKAGTYPFYRVCR
tara:strand:+ start:7797 stop:8552 length:756 start_codon:yes stop_codon:yes gene_type:complete